MRDIHETLELWGAWAASENSGLSFSPIAAGFKGILPQTSKSRIQCNDDEGVMVDGCVARLKKYRAQEYELIILHFVFRVSLRAIAKQKKCSDGTIRKDLQTAIGFINGVLAILEG
ncbi:antiterminator Q family protein [Ewingella americana]|uniref:antiterminator Q family protein n=1 Tax=Ewingella americana TaxID=41202 RepID=UPI0005557DA8|nr:antiterminator Q family protein [Ewingella americana]KAA8726727.1 antitermination protein [Ewingella americana]